MINKIPSFWVIIPAAGLSARMQLDIPKQYLSICHYTILEHAANVFLNIPEVIQLMIAVHPDDERWKLTALATNPRCQFIVGGKHRAQSVLHALRALKNRANPEDWVMVHDAARPCLQVASILKLLNHCQQENSGAILGLPVRETLKQVKNNKIITTIDREQLWQAQTPQCFRYQELTLALEHAENNQLSVTDEAMAMELAGFKVGMIMGDANNIKITYPGDELLAQVYLKENKYV
ncbi:MAG: 2-C-methyl-D-erythritol 4-phosphate cytidylyltransferase [Legionellales bacterium]|nr:2-C-methyl-D-erythritol 4-phosphate cytidylyltransferase [Legionellales bacterium]